MLVRLTILAAFVAFVIAFIPQGAIADDNPPAQNKEKQAQIDKLRFLQAASAHKSNKTKTRGKTQPNFQLNWNERQSEGFGDTLEIETDPIEYRDGLSPIYHKTKQPGLSKYSNVTMKRGTFDGDFELYQEWKKNFMFNTGPSDFRSRVTRELIIESENEQKKSDSD